jgi:carbonic anhydrase/acetyltransferase-like protein (isoleucine patch superfamily)
MSVPAKKSVLANSGVTRATRRIPMRRVLLTGAATSVLVLGSLSPTAFAHEAEGCSPDRDDVPVCPADAPAETATFLDPTVSVSGADHVSLGEQVYVGPFAEFLASDEAPISIGGQSNVQDNVLVAGSHELAGHHGAAPTGKQTEAGVEVGERVIMAHGASVIGPARIGLEGVHVPAHPEDQQEVFLSFGSQVDGATLEFNTGVSVLGRVGPGVTLPSGMLVLPGKNVTTDAEARDPALGKVRAVNEADFAFNEAVVEVNVEFARIYTELYRDAPDAVRGVSLDPGHTDFNPDRDLPSFAGVEQAVPGHRNRIIGDVNLDDPFLRYAWASGDRISLRADEGEPFDIGHIRGMDDDVIFHALEHTDLVTGDGVFYGQRAIVHGGWRVVGEGRPEAPTRIGNGVTLLDEAVVFRSTIGDGVVIGERSAVVGSELAPGTVVPPRTIVADGTVFGAVEW